MSKNNSTTKPKTNQPSSMKKVEPWIQAKTGVKIIAATSLFMAVLTAAQVIPIRGWIEGCLWGLAFGAMIWIIFYGMVWINHFLRR